MTPRLSQVSFVDSDPAVGQYAGPVTFTRGQDEDTITQYLLYWGQSALGLFLSSHLVGLSLFLERECRLRNLPVR